MEGNENREKRGNQKRQISKWEKENEIKRRWQRERRVCVGRQRTHPQEFRLTGGQPKKERD